MRAAAQHEIQVRGHRVDYRLVVSPTARKLRLRVGAQGVEVVQPRGRKTEDVAAFVDRNAEWILAQLQRVERLHSVRRPQQNRFGEMLFRGEPTRVRIEEVETGRTNRVDVTEGEIVVRRGLASQTSAARSLELWLRKQARAEIEAYLTVITARLRQ